MKNKNHLARTIQRAEWLLMAGQYGQVVALTNLRLSGEDSLELKLWRLNAVAQGNLGQHWNACQSFWRALSIRFDGITFANYVTSLFALDYTDRAVWLIRSSYKHLREPEKEILLNSIIEAIWIEALMVHQLPEQVVQDILNKSSSPQ